jgi:hypothetical protein
MWTRLVAGAAAHDINNLAQGLSNLLSMAQDAAASREVLARYTGLAREALDDLRRLGVDLRALAVTGAGGEPHRLDVLVTEVARDPGGPRDRSVELRPPLAEAQVHAPAASLRLVIRAIVRHAAAASPAGAVVSVGVALDDGRAVVVVEAPSAPAPHAGGQVELGARLAGDERDFASDTGLILAGAAVHLGGGQIVASRAAGGGLRFEVSFPRALPASAPDGHPPATSYSQARTDTLRQFERTYLEELMRATDGNLSAAARRSGIDRSNLRRMLRQLGISYAGAAGN